MIIVKLLGGLGNQMFQYAFAYALAQKRNTTVKMDARAYAKPGLRIYELDALNVSVEFATDEEIARFLPPRTFHQRVIRFLKGGADNCYREKQRARLDPNVFTVEEDVCFIGYWQTYRYFEAYRTELLEHFSPRNELHQQTKKYQNSIAASESVSLHVRRQDYVTDAITNSTHGTCGIDYYQRAMAFLEQSNHNLHCFIFSDDLEWTRKNFDFIDNKTFVALEKGIPNYEELYLMSQCRHNIIANSSFSWWGAWLNQHANPTVIAPKQWYADPTADTGDLLPDEWIRL